MPCRQPVACFLTVLIVCQSISSVLVWGNYYARKSYYSSVLCVNREVSKNRCNGKCSVVRKINKLSEQSKNCLKSQIPTYEFEVYALLEWLLRTPDTAVEHLSKWINFYTFTGYTCIPKPPQYFLAVSFS